MAQQTEQERLAAMVAQDDLEPVVTGDILAEGLKAHLGDVSSDQMQTAVENIESYGDVAVSAIKPAGLTKTATAGKQLLAAVPEKVLITLYDVRDNLVEAFEGCSLNSSLSDCLTNQINKLGSCIVNMGGTSEIFEPLNHISGLEMPNIQKNAEEVVARTIQCYKLGTVKEAKIKDDGNEINIQFEGSEGEINYIASGRITAKGWTGNEAIDYVYTPRSGKMSVKAFEGGRWVNKSETDNYHISWELNEDEKTQDSAQTLPPKEEIPQITQNNTLNSEKDGEEDIGSPIE